jgi:hypothetical protein
VSSQYLAGFLLTLPILIISAYPKVCIALDKYC